jgi:cob(I)alamin adenosyltransferase
MAIYTRGGDSGETGLGDGSRVGKGDPRIVAVGEVDELNAAVGLVRAAGVEEEADRLLERIQRELFDLGADLARPVAVGEASAPRPPLRLDGAYTARLEAAIDAVDATLPPLRSFILPGGSEAAARLHLARAVCRRAERAVVGLIRASAQTTNPECGRYLNRLADLLFVLARQAAGGAETVWRPPDR